MKVLSRNTHRAVLSATVAAGALLLAACGGSGGLYGGGSSSPPSKAGSSAASAANGRPVQVGTTGLGHVVQTADGFVVYLLTSDKAGHLSCTGSCLQLWTPVAASAGGGASGVTASLGTLARTGGAKQLTIAGHPAYTYTGDGAPGDTAGEGLKDYGGTWWAIGADGAAVTSSSGGTGQVRGY